LTPLGYVFNRLDARGTSIQSRHGLSAPASLQKTIWDFMT